MRYESKPEEPEKKEEVKEEEKKKVPYVTDEELEELYKKDKERYWDN